MRELLLREDDFGGADVIVDFLEIDEPLEVGGQGGGRAGLRGGDQRSTMFLGPRRGGLDHLFDEADVEPGAFEEADEHAVFEIVGEAGGFIGVAQIVAPQIDDHPHGRRREKLVHVPAGIGDGFEDENRFEEEVWFYAPEETEGGGASLRVDEQIDGVLHQRVVGRDKANIFTRDRAGAIEGRQHPVLRNGGKALHVGVAGIKEQISRLVILESHPKVVEEIGEKRAEKRSGVDGADAVDDVGRDGGVEGVKFQQTVSALFHFQRKLAAELDGLGDEGVELGLANLGTAGAVVMGEGQEAGFEFFLIVVAAVERGLEGVEAAVIPLDDALLGAASDVGDINADRLGLSDTVEAADALFEEARVQREIEQDEVVGKLEIATLAANLGADEELRTVGLGEPRGLAVALHQRQAFVKEADLETDFLLQGGLEGDDLALGFADEEDLGRTLREQKGDEPVETRVLAEGVAERAVLAGFFGLEFAGNAREVREILAGVERGGTEFTFRKAGHRRAGIAKHDAAGAVLVEERLEQRFAGAGFRLGERTEVFGETRGIAVEDFF